MHPGRLAAMLLALGLLGCGAASPPATPPPSAAPIGPPVRFSFEALDGSPLSTESLAGRISVVAFLTTYDVASQVQARIIGAIGRRHTPRVNVAALILEPPDHRPLIEAFASSLGLTYPVAIADAATIAGQGPFAGLHHVPSVVILDRQGREAHRRLGLADEATLEAAVRAVEQQQR
jgi:hypothetical protein